MGVKKKSGEKAKNTLKKAAQYRKKQKEDIIKKHDKLNNV